jgi:hypothetical protein
LSSQGPEITSVSRSSASQRLVRNGSAPGAAKLSDAAQTTMAEPVVSIGLRDRALVHTLVSGMV